MSRIAFFAITVVFSGSALAQQTLTNATPVAYDFTGFTAAGFAPTPGPGQLDSDEWIALGWSGDAHIAANRESGKCSST